MPIDKYEAEQQIHTALLAFLLDHRQPTVGKFKANLTNHDSDWVDVGTHSLPAARFLRDDVKGYSTLSGQLLEKFVRHADALLWEQSYRIGDDPVSDEFMDNYGFTEIIGMRGPFVSDRIRCGLGIWGPHISYPCHRHGAEEIYLLLSGSARFFLDAETDTLASAGDLVHVIPNQPHGFRTGSEPAIAVYLWQGGDLREKSTFV